MTFCPNGGGKRRRKETEIEKSGIDVSAPPPSTSNSVVRGTLCRKSLNIRVGSLFPLANTGEGLNATGLLPTLQQEMAQR